jgi:integrase/recombinase XerC
MVIKDAIEDYLESVKLARSAHTARTYRNAMNRFVYSLSNNGINVNQDPPDSLNEDSIVLFANELKNNSATTEQLYIIAVKGFFEYLSAESLSPINLPKLKLLIRQRTRRPGKRLPQFPANAISNLIESLLIQDTCSNSDDINVNLREARDRAFLITLADTGLRVHEACNLRRGDIDWSEGRAQIIGKGNREAIVRFSRRSQKAIKDYIQLRSTLDGSSGKQLTSLPLFARHDKGSGKKVKPITPTTGRNIVAEKVKLFFGDDMVGKITPHSFRHYFVTRILITTGNLKLAQNLARHQNIAVTQRYAHLSDDELDKGYWNVFEEK